MVTKELVQEVDKMTTFEEINEAWDLLKGRYNELKRRATLLFRVGDPVEFDGRRGYKKGVVTKVNQTTCVVKVEGGGPDWRVATSLLRKCNG